MASLLKYINADIVNSETIFEAACLSEFFNSGGMVITESVAGFVAGAKKLIDELNVENGSSISDEPSESTVNRLNRFANILAGLEYFRQKNVGTEEKEALLQVLDDKDITEYVTRMANEKAEAIVAEIKTHFVKGKILHRDRLDQMIEDIRKFYISKKANVGNLLHVQHKITE